MGRGSGKIWTSYINAYKCILKKFGKNVSAVLYFLSKCFYDQYVDFSIVKSFRMDTT